MGKVVNFEKIPLRDENFEFPDLLGAAYEYLIKKFADLANKKAGEFYTPRSVVGLMIDILDPTAKTVDELKKLNLPAGVDITIKI